MGEHSARIDFGLWNPSEQESSGEAEGAVLHRDIVVGVWDIGESDIVAKVEHERTGADRKVHPEPDDRADIRRRERLRLLGIAVKFGAFADFKRESGSEKYASGYRPRRGGA